MRRPELEWIHQGVFPSDSTVMGVLSTDVRARIWRLADAHHWLRLGGPPLGWFLQEVVRSPNDGGPWRRVRRKSWVRTILRADRDWGSAGAGVGAQADADVGSRPPVPLLDAVAAVWSTVGAVPRLLGEAPKVALLSLLASAPRRFFRSVGGSRPSRCSITGVARSFDAAEPALAAAQRVMGA